MEQNFNPYTNPQEDQNQNNINGYDPQQFRAYSKKPVNYFETASWALGICAILSCTFFYVSYMFGALAILFALLSRGGHMKLSPKARLGLFLGIFAIIFTTVVTVGAFYIAIEEFGSIENLLREYCNMYGLDFEELYGDMFQL